MKNNKLKMTVFTALFMAMTCAATFVHIPFPGMNGYLNLGDCLVLLSAWLLGPLYGAVAGGIGSMLCDLLLGYSVYAPATLVVKALMAVAASLIFKALTSKPKLSPSFASSIAGTVAELIMMGGYFLYDAFLYKSFIVAAASIVGNIVQGVFGIIAAVLTIGILKKYKIPSRFGLNEK